MSVFTLQSLQSSVAL
ncbi:hypothetical protein E2C01_055688 [Portunus trituberculatus]|uniref:Uncharacterized protein n=1 Tax=Portunus trituberculatus TaxID=210409 RepID=A0A5B7GYD9_PORTR|nr:hypothetical protein [Portunus trituberculatus]